MCLYFQSGTAELLQVRHCAILHYFFSYEKHFTKLQCYCSKNNVLDQELNTFIFIVSQSFFKILKNLNCQPYKPLNLLKIGFQSGFHCTHCSIILCHYTPLYFKHIICYSNKICPQYNIIIPMFGIGTKLVLGQVINNRIRELVSN